MHLEIILRCNFSLKLYFYRCWKNADIRYSLVLPFCFCRLGGRTGSEFPPTTPLPADPELPPLLPMTPTPLPGAKPPTELGDTKDEPCTPDWLEPKPRIPEPTTPGAAPSRPVEDVGPPTVMFPLPMEPTALLVVAVLTPPKEPGKLDPTAWA